MIHFWGFKLYNNDYQLIYLFLFNGWVRNRFSSSTRVHSIDFTSSFSWSGSFKMDCLL